VCLSIYEKDHCYASHLGLSAAQSGLVTLPYAIVAVAMIRLGEKATLRFKTKLFKNAPMNGRLRNTEKSIKGTSCRRSMMMRIRTRLV
jgi:hypothetical protein